MCGDFKAYGMDVKMYSSRHGMIVLPAGRGDLVRESLLVVCHTVKIWGFVRGQGGMRNIKQIVRIEQRCEVSKWQRNI